MTNNVIDFVLMFIFDFDVQVYGCSISWEGNTIITACGDKMVRVFDSRSGTIAQTLTGHTGWVSVCCEDESGLCVFGVWSWCCVGCLDFALPFFLFCFVCAFCV